MERIEYIIIHIQNSYPGKRYSYYNSDNELIFYATKSTFPDYIKFSYLKKPKGWHILSDEEKAQERFYFQYNTKGVLRVMCKLLNRKPLTEIEQLFTVELFWNFTQYENDFMYEFGEELFPDIDMTDCEF